MGDNTSHDEMITTNAMVDYKIYGDIQGQSYYVMINGKLLVLGFKPFQYRYISLRLVPITVVKCPLVNTKNNVPKEEILPPLIEDHCNIGITKGLFCSSGPNRNDKETSLSQIFENRDHKETTSRRICEVSTFAGMFIDPLCLVSHEKSGAMKETSRDSCKDVLKYIPKDTS